MSRPTTHLESSKLQTLLSNIIRRVGIDFPEWVENRENDPGITVLQLLAFLAEALFFREGEMPEQTRRRLWELGCSLQRLAGGTIRFQPLTPPESSSIKRVRYFYGQMLSVGDFQTEQGYFLEKQKRHNRYLHGFGVVDGLEVKGGGNKVIVSPGIALDPAGNEIIVPAPVELALGTRSGDGYVSLKYSERDSDPLPFRGGDQYTRIEEGFELSLQGILADCGLAIARLIWTGEECQLDPEFKPCRVNPCS